MSRRNINNYKTAKIINSKFHLLDCIYLRVIIDPHNDQLSVGPIAGRALHRHGQRCRYGSHMFLLWLPHVFVAHCKMVLLNYFCRSQFRYMAFFHLWNSFFVIVYYLVNFGDYIWQTGHSNWVTWSFVQVRHYAQCSSHRTPRIHYDSSRLKTIRKSLAKQRLPQYLWQKQGDVRIRKKFRSWKKHHFGWDFVWAVGPPMDHNVYPNGVPVASSVGSQPLN